MFNNFRYIKVFLFILFCISFLFVHKNIYAQINFEQIESPEDLDGLVHWTYDGMVVFASDAALSDEQPNEGRIQAVIYRQIGANSEFEEVARLQRPDTWEEFVELGGTELIQVLLDATENETDEELWDFIKENPEIDEYGFLGFNPDLWRALGTVYFDTETVDLPDREEVAYKVRYVMEDGEITDFFLHGSAYVGQEPNLLRPQFLDRTESKNHVGVRWFSSLEGGDDAFFGKVYKQVGEEEVFEPIEGRIMALRDIDNDIIIYEVDDSAEPNHAYRYYVKPLDIVGNPGPASDTLTVLSVDFNNLPLVTNATATDTTAGIHLSWDKIEDLPYITGIEIQRSRDARHSYVTLDTLSVRSTEYLDTRLVPNQTYYYRFRIVTMRATQDLPSAVASASFRNTLPPSPPSGLTAKPEEDGIRLNWDSSAEADLFGYYVYRSTNTSDSMQVVSRAISDTTTFFDDSEELDGRTNYVYKVKAVNMSELESEYSNRAVARPDRIVRPPTPTGIDGYAEQQRIRLFWRDQKRRDGAVKGYHVYRHQNRVNQFPDGESASIQAEQTGFERINSELITSTSYDDREVRSGENYYYSISTVDHFGVESGLSTPKRLTTESAALRPPSQVSARVVTGGIEVRWNRTMQENVEEYQIYRRERGQDTPSLVGSVSAETTRFTDDEVTEETLYWYSVSVVRGDQESSRGREQSVTVR